MQAMKIERFQAKISSHFSHCMIDCEIPNTPKDEALKIYRILKQFNLLVQIRHAIRPVRRDRIKMVDCNWQSVKFTEITTDFS